MRNVILLSRWRHHGNLAVWDAIINCYCEEYQGVYLDPPNAAEDCLAILIRHFCKSIFYLKNNEEQTIERIIEDIAEVGLKDNVAFEAVRPLVQFFESRVTGKEIRNSPSGIFNDLELYGSLVGEGHIRLHYKLLKLLTKAVQSTPEEDQGRYLHEIIMGLWSGPAYPYGNSWKDECTSADVARAAGRQAENTRSGYLECINPLVAILGRLIIELRDVFGLPDEYRLDYPEHSFKPEDVELLITRVLSKLKQVGIETSGLGPCRPPKPLRRFNRTPDKDGAATPSCVSLIEFICKGVDFIIENDDNLKALRREDDYFQTLPQESYAGNAHNFVGDPLTFKLF
jgi:hypothetical protein